jgi:hypothetical protein
MKEGTKVNTTSYIKDIFVPAVAAAKQHFKEQVSHFKKMALCPTLQKICNSGSEPI